MDNLEFLDAGEPAKEDVQPVAEEAKAEEVKVSEAAPEPKGAERDEHGRFKAKEPAKEEARAQPEPQPTAETQPEAKPEPVMVPLTALHETRDKVKALEAQLAQFQQRPQEQAPPPDPYEDPEGFAAYQNNVVNQQILNTKLDISEEMARGVHGDETVDAARDWALAQFRSNPAFQAEVLRQRNPYGYVVQQYQRNESLSKLGGDPKQIEAFLAWQQAQTALAQQQPAAQAASPATPAPPQSIASAPSAGGVAHIAIGEGVAFDETFRN